jgi:hypothetical protein
MALLEQNGNLCLFWCFCYEEGDNSNVVTFFYGGGVMEKVMAEGGFFFFFFKFILFLCGAFGLVH